MATVLIPSALRPDAAGADRLSIPGGTVGEVLRELARLHPVLGRKVLDERGGVRRHVAVFLGDDDVRGLEGLATRCADRAEISLVPALAGG
jgi:molybdopterin synthase sulfur carrier subunit